MEAALSEGRTMQVKVYVEVEDEGIYTYESVEVEVDNESPRVALVMALPQAMVPLAEKVKVTPSQIVGGLAARVMDDLRRLERADDR